MAAKKNSNTIMVVGVIKSIFWGICSIFYTVSRNIWRMPVKPFPDEDPGPKPERARGG